MPRVAEFWFDERFSSKRDELIAIVRKHFAQAEQKLKAVGTWLKTEYSDEKIKKLLEQKRKSNRQKDAGQFSPPNGRTVVKSSSNVADFQLDDLHIAALEQAFVALNHQNRHGDLLRLLGSNQPRKEKETNALRAIVVCSCIVDPDSSEWLSNVTPLANCSWNSHSSEFPKAKGRAAIARSWGHEALELLEEACIVLGWKQKAESTVVSACFEESVRENRKGPAPRAGRAVKASKATNQIIESKSLENSVPIVWKEPNEPTIVTDCKTAAKWLKVKDWRTVKRMADRHEIAARRVGRKVILDCDDLDTINPGVLKEARE